MDEFLLPLFLLEIVLVPDEVVPLHIFEERYKEMIGECLEKRERAPDEAEFGVVYLRGKQAQRVGCTARIKDVIRRHDDGRMDILAVGQRRFEVLFTNDRKPYLRAAVEFFDDEETAVPDKSQVDRARSLFRDVLQRLEITADPAGLEREFRRLSFQIAAALPIGPEFKQQVLVMRDERERLRRLSDVMEKLIPALERRQQARTKASGNGHLIPSSGSE
ncbi:MAG TPA: LON peptidase substrate-binding domain-containing protein [Terriglobia bacterium]|nr:LON peptidase substrate-binding domain-containing protein [Terriglobia bacterium]